MHGLSACLQSPPGSPSQKGANSLTSGQLPASAPPEAEARLAATTAEPSREAQSGGSYAASWLPACQRGVHYCRGNHRQPVAGRFLHAETPVSMHGLEQQSEGQAGSSLAVM